MADLPIDIQPSLAKPPVTPAAAPQPVNAPRFDDHLRRAGDKQPAEPSPGRTEADEPSDAERTSSDSSEESTKKQLSQPVPVGSSGPLQAALTQ